MLRPESVCGWIRINPSTVPVPLWYADLQGERWMWSELWLIDKYHLGYHITVKCRYRGHILPVHCLITSREPGTPPTPPPPPIKGGQICIDNSTFWMQHGAQAHLGTTYMDDTIQWCFATAAGDSLRTAERSGSRPLHTAPPDSIWKKAWIMICCCLE